MDKARFASSIQEGLGRLGVTVGADVAEGLWRYQEQLLKWNAKVNLTAITEPMEVLEKHFIDSLAVLPEVEGAQSLLDIGAGAGLPGIPIALARPELRVTLVDSVDKKVTFMRVALATLGLAPRCRALHLRVAGAPEPEGLDRAEVVVSRAFRDLPEWLLLARSYVAPGGRVVAMLGRPPDRPEVIVAAAGGRLLGMRTYRLPFSGAERAVAVVSFESA